jgi:putative ABC transport system permease protein
LRFVAFPLKNLWRRPGRAIFAAIGISLAIATYTSMTVLFGGVADIWKKNLIDIGVHALIVQDMQIDWVASSLPDSVASDVAELPEVAAAEGELLSFLTTEDGTAILVSGWQTNSMLWDRLEFVDGARPRAVNPDGAAIGEDLATILGLEVGDKLNLDGLDVEIAGIFRASDLLTGGRVTTALKTLQELMFRDGTVTAVNVVLNEPENPDAIDAVKSFIGSRYPGLAVRPTAQLDQDNRMIDLLNVLRNVVIWVVTLVGVAGTANIMLMAVNERRSEIGLLVAIGWSPGRVIALFLLEAVLLASAAGALGIAIGLVIIEIVRNSATLAAFLSGPVSPAVLIQAFALAVGIGTLGGILPALRALSVPADNALRAI